ncbi:aldo/keto reductase family oxidoreductase [Metabacillus sp. GX 13764]|uniref:aldo/keto reductase n=1 Tax=Metabacillus kandeliae TaxID=2900151 RepID=UPI001E5296FD|nr:aldo/keto reductase family oxidoreductase [Metabacillus kandeliae]MCD7036206.1 aldo/keto reductase family oxidoreductase [Metabacillus kandeliae]
MEKIQLAEDLSFSRIIHGLWRLADWNQSSGETFKLIKDCMDLGLTTFDHADIYGGYTCEALFGKALALEPSLREQMELVTKCGINLKSDVKHYNTSRDYIVKQAEQSLQNLQTDYIDLLLIHRPDPFMDPEAVAEAFTALKKSGKVRHFGVSNFKSSQFRMLQSYLEMPLVTNQIELSAYQLENVEDGTLDLCQEMRIPPMAWSPLAGGSIFQAEGDKAVRLREVLEETAQQIGAGGIDEVLYAWLLVHPARIMPITGSGKIERVKAAVNALDLTLSREQWFKILEASRGHEVA